MSPVSPIFDIASTVNNNQLSSYYVSLLITIEYLQYAWRILTIRRSLVKLLGMVRTVTKMVTGCVRTMKVAKFQLDGKVFVLSGLWKIWDSIYIWMIPKLNWPETVAPDERRPHVVGNVWVIIQGIPSSPVLVPPRAHYSLVQIWTGNCWNLKYL